MPQFPLLIEDSPPVFTRPDGLARLAHALASPKTALAGIAPEDTQKPAVREIVSLAPGATIPEQEPPPASPGVKHYSQGSYGQTIPLSLGRRRLSGRVIQASALVPRLVGNREYEVTYQLPLPAAVEPEAERPGDERRPETQTVWCPHCNCFYCYVGPLDPGKRFDLDDKGTWPYAYQIGYWESYGEVLKWSYHRLDSILPGQYTFGAVVPEFGEGHWQAPRHECDKTAPDPCSFAIEEWSRFDNGAFGVAYSPCAVYAYAAMLNHAGDPELNYWTDIGFYWQVMNTVANSYWDIINNPVDAYSPADAWDTIEVYRVYYDPNRADEFQTPELSNRLPKGWFILDTIHDEIVEVWTEDQMLSDLDHSEFVTPGGPTWREYVAENGGWSPIDQPDPTFMYRAPENPGDGLSAMLAASSATDIGEPVDYECGPIFDFGDLHPHL